MEITITTDGNADNTTIKFNGKTQEKVFEFGISIRAGRKIKMQVKKARDGMSEFLSYFGEDFREFDRELKEEENYVGTIGTKGGHT
ncbi:MAG: hypothetical protein DDT42_00440 [candidate division WS2 bacterium]|uniref:Uncharacterized protein n=1 Tax=Psychracetigena formicireducens TaxID=2986056 RepID=A0A9E2F6H6_PSYF1|nr:hypothetical protein [Candidatus Psychracetigena formicireducens]